MAAPISLAHYPLAETFGSRLSVPHLHRREVQVWHVATGEVGDESILSPTERARLHRFKRRSDRLRFITAATLLRTVASHHIGVPPAQLEVSRNCPTCPRPHGKPRLPTTSLEVSVAHSCDRVVLAVTLMGPVGVDLERLSPEIDIDRIALSILDPSEVMPESAHLKQAAFLRYWTRKEAVVKAIGTGLRVPLRDVVVTPHDQPARLLRLRQASFPRVILEDVHIDGDYLASVAVQTSEACDVTIHTPTKNFERQGFPQPIRS